ncbi:MAG TPA: hypothetical protein VIF60_01185 [Burkholderiaceae bacterium]
MTIENIICEIEASSDEYYRLTVSSYEAQSGLWLAKCRFRRTDSGEQIGGCVVSEKSQLLALISLSAKIKSELAELARPPHEWGRVALRVLLKDYRQLDVELTEILFKLQKSREAGTLSKEELHRGHWNARTLAIAGGIKFSHRLAMPSEQDRIDLMTSPEPVYQDAVINPWYLDDLNSRDSLFEFIIDPSAEVILAHEGHQARMAKGGQ